MSVDRFCGDPHPHDSHSWTRDVDGYPFDDKPWWGPDHHYCYGVVMSDALAPMLDALVEREDALRAAQVAHDDARAAAVLTAELVHRVCRFRERYGRVRIETGSSSESACDP